MGALIYSAIDLSTDMHVTLESTPTPWISWTVTASSATKILPPKAVGYDSLVDAANAVASAVELFEDYDAPSVDDALTAIAENCNDDGIYTMLDYGTGNIYLVNEHEWDED